MKRIFASLLALALVFVLFGCDFDYAGKLTGTWVCRSRESDEQIAEIMESIDLYEEEIALIDTPPVHRCDGHLQRGRHLRAGRGRNPEQAVHP